MTSRLRVAYLQVSSRALYFLLHITVQNAPTSPAEDQKIQWLEACSVHGFEGSLSEFVEGISSTEKSYRVSITETVLYSIIVQASDEDAAWQAAWDYQCLWNKDDVEAEVTEIIETDDNVVPVNRGD